MVVVVVVVEVCFPPSPLPRVPVRVAKVGIAGFENGRACNKTRGIRPNGTHVRAWLYPCLYLSNENALPTHTHTRARPSGAE